MTQERKQFQRTKDGHLILMSAEERDLLITDLTARINCGVICLIERVDDFGPRFRDEKLTGFCYDDIGRFHFEVGGGLDIVFAEKIMPYLRPMSSMTEEEVKEFAALESIDILGGDTKITCVELNIDAIDWLNKNKFDYRGLIPMGLALEAPKDMYTKIK